MQARECVEMAVGLVADRNMEKILEKIDQGKELLEVESALVKKYMSSINIAVDTIASRYYETRAEKDAVSDSEKKIDYSLLADRIYDVVRVTDAAGGQVEFYQLPFNLYVPQKNTLYTVEYKYLPKKAVGLDSELELLPVVPSKAVAYLMASDISLARGLYDESKFFFSKFDSEMTQVVSRRRSRTLRAINLLG